ncbi:MAG: hypothetical protein KJ995_06580 [Candidatus Omnitrophica bacterium]|nr:hypothetical protein [Candidatus Omnitrophota bacterium]MBU1128465.1 hypothetical protein [Candidatus Omnitrophota bacterium]MBU1657139.1 hypothetical protein [Candidatus Omnitrophota bacterium]MBU1784942.1 hypothetical protein [Candidatus Omnitrophota bacterium]MBU1852049.1 hypothetical protein [Candidatus Omnitrophota bacterium]
MEVRVYRGANSAISSGSGKLREYIANGGNLSNLYVDKVGMGILQT